MLQPDRQSILPRTVRPVVSTLPQARHRYGPPDPKVVGLSLAGGACPKAHPTLTAIAAVRSGDPVTLLRDGESW